MSPEDSEDSRYSGYDAFAASYAEHAAQNTFNALYDRPAILSLAGAVSGLRVLDLGCAGGDLSAELAARGADVLGVDLSAELIGIARRRFGDRCRFEVADIGSRLPADDGAYDLVTASLVLHYLADWAPALAEIRRVLKPSGALVLSTHHPGEDWRWFDRPDYFVTERVTDLWTVNGRQVEVSFYRRPLSAVFDAIRDAGFTVDRLAEPMPLPEVQDRSPADWQLLTTSPRFLYIRAFT